MRSEHWSRVVPIVDSFNDPEDPDIVFIVTDLLHTTTYPAWKYLEDVLEFGGQILGVSLSYRLLRLHKSWLTCTTTGSDVLPSPWDQQCVGIQSSWYSYLHLFSYHAATSFGEHSLKIRSSTMSPQGFHPVLQAHLPNLSGPAPFRPHCEYFALYYFNDLRNAVHDKGVEELSGRNHDFAAFAFIMEMLFVEVRLALPFFSAFCLSFSGTVSNVIWILISPVL